MLERLRARDGEHVFAQLLTVREVAAALGVSTATIYAIVERGELAHTRVGNSIRIVPEAVNDYLGRSQ